MTKYVKIDYKNQSQYDDGAQDPKRITLHTWEADIPGLAGVVWLKNVLDSQRLSVHYGVTRDGVIGQYLRPNQKGRHVLNNNTGNIGIEQAGFARYKKSDWMSLKHHWQLVRVARLIAQLSRDYDIPLRHSTEHGVCQHRDFHVGHTDCGDGYPFFYVLRLAMGFRKTMFR